MVSLKAVRSAQVILANLINKAISQREAHIENNATTVTKLLEDSAFVQSEKDELSSMLQEGT
jgi:Trp operon repressor